MSFYVSTATFFFAPLWRMGPRCSSAETQVCHRSYIIAASKRYVILLVFIILRWSFNYESNVFRYNKILIDCVFGNSKFVVPSTLTIDLGFASVNSQCLGDNLLFPHTQSISIYYVTFTFIVHFISIKPVLRDHLSYATIFHCSLGRSHKTGLTVSISHSIFEVTYFSNSW